MAATTVAVLFVPKGACESISALPRLWDSSDDRSQKDISQYAPDLIRSFSIIAHIDHGKSTLSDRLLELTGTIKRDAGRPRVLDKLNVERERGITVKAQSVSMFHTHTDGRTYLLNLIDTPGHVDFSYEVSRSLAACQGCVLLVDAAQGIQAQTVSNFYLAFGEGLAIVPALNKVDLPGAEPEKVKGQLEAAFELPADDIVAVSAKTGLNVEKLLTTIVDRTPAPSGSVDGDFKAMLFDTWYDAYQGVVCLVAVKQGKIKRGQKVTSTHSGLSYEVTELGIMHPEHQATTSLQAGQVGYLFLGMKTTRDALIGDTFYLEGRPVEPLEGFRPAKSVVFSGLFPVDSTEFGKLQDALDRLTLNDASVSVSRETSMALGQGFRLGFLGLLHQDVFSQRLEEEHKADVINTSPTVPYRITYHPKGGKVVGEEKIIKNPSEFPEVKELADVRCFSEPIVAATLIFPNAYTGAMMELCSSHRAERMESTLIDESRTMLKCRIPMAEILVDFYDALKSKSQGYASFDYEEVGYQEAELVKVNILLNGKPVDALATIAHKDAADRVAKDWVTRLKKVIDRQLVEIIIQGAVNGRVVARESLSALRKDVTAKLYGGDITRKKKLLEKQKAGKKRMKSVAGGIELPREAFFSLIKRA
ncbi:hypothetical protein HK101_000767 [Irineochytrium annulatum]|nr:hypothetical protein HK101_000767 [Irineochytrium annulatum]